MGFDFVTAHYHTDDSEVSLTIRLGKGEYEGGEVVLRHLRDSADAGKVQTVIKQTDGEATLFYGQQYHEVLPVVAGERHMLVVWFRAGGFRVKVCPCCRMNRRRADCVLGGVVCGAREEREKAEKERRIEAYERGRAAGMGGSGRVMGEDEEGEVMDLGASSGGPPAFDAAQEVSDSELYG